jgi:hypothetical protein
MGSISKIEKGAEETDVGKELLKALRDAPVRIVVLRKKYFPYGELDPFWDARVHECKAKGTYPFYANILGTTAGNLMGDHWKSMEPTPRQFWMDRPDADEESYAHHDPIFGFSSFREYEIVMPLALVLESAHRRKLLKQHFNHGVRHGVLATSLGKGYVLFEITLSRQDDFTKPSVMNGANFKLRPYGNAVATPLPTGAEYVGPEWDCSLFAI